MLLRRLIARSISISNELEITFHVRSSQLLRNVMHLWRHQQSIVTSSTNSKPSEWDRGHYVKNIDFIVIYGFVMSKRNKRMYLLSSHTVYVVMWVLIWCSFLSSLRNSGNEHQKKPSWSHKQSPYIYVFDRRFGKNCQTSYVWTIINSGFVASRQRKLCR